MVVFKPQRIMPPEELTVLQLLNKRHSLSGKTRLKFEQLNTGYKGEMNFHRRLVESIHPALTFNNLILNYDDSELQIDSLAIIDNDIYLFEVKNYYGDYFIKDDEWYNVKSQNEIRNPFLQLNRSRYLFQKILQQQGFKFQVHPYLIFINKQFTLYNSPINNQLILPTQVNRLLNHLSRRSLTPEIHHQQLFDYLKTNRLSNSSYMKLPEYNFDELRKGITCLTCNNYLKERTNKRLVCNYCQKKIPTHIAVMNNVKQFNILFPNEKIKTTTIYKWCGKILSKTTIWRILTKHMKKVGKTKSAHYLLDDRNEHYRKIINKIKKATNNITL